ncbi:vWA domain-containing protein [Sandaracinus amylolyticus]|uniref:Tryptophan synthase alpha chain n=1 Tax=Sandaracinus amylolyticus TaxID=927083 RepID=A0A0F6YEY4_9BACT|nr:MopE-related protein [Sandaracinus amylolyticus]AKF02991.1 Tryptophan synthase alpha chain [Sandaracinus amylolyticus]
MALVSACAVWATADVAEAQATVSPYFLVIFDTSGSMDASTGGGDNSCGQPRVRLNDAKCVLQRVVNGYGDVTFGLERFAQSCSGRCRSCAGGTCNCSCSASCTATASSGQVIVPVRADNQRDILEWVDFSCDQCSAMAPGTDPELVASGNTPLGGALLAARAYYTGGASPLVGDTFGACRPVNVILLTDGEETCGGDARSAASLLRSTTVGGTTYDIRTYVIGFGVPAGDAAIEAIAAAGGTDAPGASRGFYATDETSLALAFSQIIADSTRFETCNGADDDCDTRIDEGFTLYCDRPGGVSAPRLCADPGERVCNGTDDNCDGAIDEGLVNACGSCGPAPSEVCNAADDDCDGAIDERACSCPAPAPEICDGLDNDCDTRVDEGPLTRPCGTDVGECTAGTQTCVVGGSGEWGLCVGSTGPRTETCNGLDDDCDGAVDGFVEPCGSDTGACQRGSRACTAGSYGACIGAIDPTTERCNASDDDCDTRVDEGDPGSGAACGSTVGACRGGTLRCVAGTLTCTGGVGPMSEVCDGDDDDCDGRVDEGNPGGGASCGESDVGECHLGTLQCTGGALVCSGARGPRGELCNTLDDDCDTRVDEGDPEAGAPCGDDTGECSAGTTRCRGGTLVCDGGAGPSAEVCNGLDDDCDGAIDDEIPVGAACGSDVGECVPGVNVCDAESGTLVCSGAIGPTAEACNLLDDDCDTRIDEALADGATCGADEGLCMAGALRCVGGVEICVGEVPPDVEVCDCDDNDCDGATDEPPPSGSLCPPGSACVDCQCARPCVDGEFGYQCPTGRSPRVEDGVCHCVADRCDDARCATETVELAGEVACAPESDDVARCVCRNNECTFACAGVQCPPGLACDPRDTTGRCVEDDCRGLGCGDGELCDRATGACVPDPCATTDCDDALACRAGVCETSCADVECPPGARCHAGACEIDRCADVECAAREVCDPASGDCVEDRCAGRVCPEGTVCAPVTGECGVDPCDALRCPAGQICIDGDCAQEARDVDAGVARDGGRIDAGTSGDDDVRVVAAGGGGAICAVGAARSESEMPALLGLVALALVLGRRARRRRAGEGGAR